MSGKFWDVIIFWGSGNEVFLIIRELSWEGVKEGDEGMGWCGEWWILIEI